MTSAALAAAMLTAACTGSPASSPEAAATPAAQAAPSAEATPAPVASVQPSPVPSPVSALDPMFDAGQDVYLAPDGPQPRQLIAKVNTPITFHNLGDTDVSVDFINASFLSPLAVPAQGTARFTSERTVSIVYSASSAPGTTGAIQVEPTALPTPH